MFNLSLIESTLGVAWEDISEYWSNDFWAAASFVMKEKLW